MAISIIAFVLGVLVSSAVRSIVSSFQRPAPAPNAMLERIAAPFYALDRHWRFTYINAQCEAYYGRSRRDLMGQDIWSALPEIAGSTFEEECRRAVSRGEPVHFETLCPLTERWVEVHAYPSDEGMSVYLRDVTDRRSAEAERDRFFAVATDMLVVADFNGYFVRVNPAWERVTGWSMTELTLKPWLSFVHPEDRERTIAEAERILGGSDTLHFENRYLTKDGSYRWISWRSRPVPEEGLLYCAATDVTERKEAERSLQEARDTLEVRIAERTVELERVVGALQEEIEIRNRAEEELREAKRFIESVMASSTSIIYVFDRDLEKSTYVNHDVADFLGYTGEEREKLGENFLCGILHPDDVSLLKDHIRRYDRSDEQGVVEFEARVRHRSGEYRWFWFRERVFERRADGSVRQVMGTAQDITARREAEARAMEASEAKSRFLANMSHEIRTPMTAILGFSELLKDPSITEHEWMKYVDTICRNGQYLIAIINDILDLSKIEAGKLGIELIPTSPVEVVRDAVSLLEGKATEKNLELTATYEGLLPTKIRTDPCRLRQILLNLIGNALKFTESGSVHVAVRCPEPSKLEVEVRDTGVGMTPEQQARLFHAFEQGDVSTTRQYGGTGLGLIISKRLARMLGGDIRCTSVAGKGSSFVVEIATGSLDWVAYEPVAPTNEAAKSSANRHAVFAEAKVSGRILLAEDGKDNQRLICHYLRKVGAQIVVVDNGRSAVDAVVRASELGQPFDLVLMDMQMPILDGYSATEEIRRIGSSIPVVALTAHAMTDNRDRCMAVGCDGFLSKPIEVERFMETVKRYLGRPEGESGSDEGRSGERDPIFDDPEFQRLIRVFISHLAERAEQITRCLATHDMEDLAMCAHQLRGAAGGYGFANVSKAAAGVERAIRGGAAEEEVSRATHALLGQIEGVIAPPAR
jgi:PAS domain S-box-containing protein